MVSKQNNVFTWHNLLYSGQTRLPLYIIPSYLTDIFIYSIVVDV